MHGVTLKTMLHHAWFNGITLMNCNDLSIIIILYCTSCGFQTIYSSIHNDNFKKCMKVLSSAQLVFIKKFYACNVTECFQYLFT